MDHSAKSNDGKEIPPSEELTEEELIKTYGDMKLACSPKRFAKTMNGLSADHLAAISSKTGMGGLTKMQPVLLRRMILVRLAQRFNSEKQSVPIGGADIPITPTDVNQIMDLPIQGKDILVRLKKKVDKNYLRTYGHNSKLSIPHLEEQIKNSTTPDDHFIRLFVLYAIGTLLAPTANSYVHEKYLTLVENVAEIPNFNWGRFTLNHLFSSIDKFNQKGDGTLQGNLPLLQVWYFEHVRAGISYDDIPPPLIARWDEQKATIRTAVYDSGNLDIGLVTMNIRAQHMPTNITHNNANYKDRQKDEETSYLAEPEGHTFSNQTITSEQMDKILRFVDERIAEHEKKMGRHLMQVDHKFDGKFMSIYEDIIDIKRAIGNDPRLSKMEDSLRDVQRELQETRSLLWSKLQSTPKDIYVQDQVNRRDENISRPTPTCHASTAMFGCATTTTANKQPVLRTSILDKLTPTRKPIFDNDYRLTDEDHEAAVFIRVSHDPADVAQIGDYDITAKHLKPTVTKKFYYDQVINAYVQISNIETATTAVLTTTDSRKLVGDCGSGSFPFGRGNRWSERIAKKFIGRRMVHVPLHVHDCHWHLVVFNFEKEETQILNSSQEYRDEAKEAVLVKNIQWCINEAVANGSVATAKPIDITKWKTTCYTNIPQQNNNHSCGAFTLKYMLAWDGERMTEDFTQAHIDNFSYKVCSRVLRSDCNRLRRESYKNPITKEEYEASMPKEPNGADDDIIELPNPTDIPNLHEVMETSKPDVAGKAKRKHGRPRKFKVEDPKDDAKNTLKEQFSTENIVALLDGKRKRFPSRHKTDPFKSQ